MKCEKCNKRVTFIVTNIKKGKSMHFCDVHFWNYCEETTETLKQIREIECQEKAE